MCSKLHFDQRSSLTPVFPVENKSDIDKNRCRKVYIDVFEPDDHLHFIILYI
jgi:hypothetical protein